MNAKELYATQSRITAVKFSDGSIFTPAEVWAEVDKRHQEVPTSLEVSGGFWTFVKNCFPYTLFERSTGKLVQISAGGYEFGIARQ